MGWLFVIGESNAGDWVVRHKRMAFRSTSRLESMEKGDRFVLYVTRGAFHNPTRDESRVFASGRLGSALQDRPVELIGETFERSAALSFEGQVLSMRDGVPFAPLVPRMSFIRKPESWFAYVRKSAVSVPDEDLEILANEIRRAAAQRG